MNAPEQQAAALARLREILKPGATVYSVQRHTSRSGASRSVSVMANTPADAPAELDALVALALGAQMDRKHGGIRVYSTHAGIHVDAGAALVSRLASTLGFSLQHRPL